MDTDILLKDDIVDPPLTIIHAVHERGDTLSSFAHAVRIALASKGELEIVDVRGNNTGQDGLGVRSLLEQWGFLPEGAEREDVAAVGLRVKKIIKPGGGARKEISKRLLRRRHDILVVGTEARKGLAQLFGQDLAEYLALSTRQTTLFIPRKARPFVDPRTGDFRLRKILVPVADEPSPEASLELLQRLLKVLDGVSSVEVVGFHVGDEFPFVSASLLEGFAWTEVLGKEPIAPAILKAAKKHKPDLIVMSTNGRDTLSQKIVGSITEQVLRSVTCPVLAVATPE